MRERGVAVAVHPHDLGGDALPHPRLVAGVGQDHQPAVRVQVDEAGRTMRPVASIGAGGARLPVDFPV